MPFYNPFVTRVLEVPTIVYPSQGLERVLDRRAENIRNHIIGLDACNLNLSNPSLESPSYQIAFLSEDNGSIVTLLWSFVSPEISTSRAFRDFEPEEGILSNDEILVAVTREERLRKFCGDDLGKYFAERPAFPEGYMIGEDF